MQLQWRAEDAERVEDRVRDRVVVEDRDKDKRGVRDKDRVEDKVSAVEENEECKYTII